MIIKDPEVARLFADETRRQILHNLRHRELSTNDLAKALNKNHSSIIHHMKLLQDAGLVEETRVEKRRNIVQSYYGSTAKKFIISYSLSDSLDAAEIFTWQKEMLNEIADELDAFGIEVPIDERKRILELLAECYVREQKALEETIEHQTKPLELEKPVYAAIIRLLTHMRLVKDEKYARTIDELCRLMEFQPKAEGDN
jgi:DNA-binding transcriptional ArsR family regulator